MTDPRQPTYEQLLDWLEGRLSTEKAAAIAAQVESADETVQAQAAWLRAFLALSDEIALDEPPPSLRAALRERFAKYARQRTARQDERPGFIQQLIGQLTFDSQWQPALSGVRGAEASRIRQLIYATDAAEIVLTLQSHADRLALSGQVFPLTAESPEPFRVRIWAAAEEIGATTADELGAFAFSAIAPGEYQMVLSTGALSILLAPLHLESQG